MFPCMSPLSTCERDHCVATRRQYALRLIDELTNLNLRLLFRNLKGPRVEKKKNKTKRTCPLRSWSVLIDMPDSPISNTRRAPPGKKIIGMLAAMATVTSKLTTYCRCSTSKSVLPDPLNGSKVFRLPCRLMLTAETPAPVPIAQLAPRPRPRV